MKIYVYRCEINLNHPMIEEAVRKLPVMTATDIRIATFISRPFPSIAAAADTMKAELMARLETLIAMDPGIDFAAIAENNPFHLKSVEEIEADLQDAESAEYLESWDLKTVQRVTCITGPLPTLDDQHLDSPADFIFKYHITEFEDDIELPDRAAVELHAGTLTIQ